MPYELQACADMACHVGEYSNFESASSEYNQYLSMHLTLAVHQPDQLLVKHDLDCKGLMLTFQGECIEHLSVQLPYQ